MRISEIFYKLQGEGVRAGIPMTFVRLQGCNLRCVWCDTAYAQDTDGGEEMTLSAITKRVRELSPYEKAWVCITGGEPLLNDTHLKFLVFALHRQGYRIEIETNGTFPPPPWMHRVNCWVIDAKCPSSGQVSELESWLPGRLKDQVKFVVQTREDLDFVLSTLKSVLCLPQVLISPVLRCDSNGRVMLGDGWLAEVSDFCAEYRLRFSLQQHKIVYGDKRGV